MTLALAKHLVDHGLVSAPEMDDVLQRQVLFGGSLDTNLLELDLLDEPALTSALAEVHRLPAATASLLEQRDNRIANLFPPRLARKYQVIPVYVAGRAVHCLAAARIDPLVAEEIGFMLSLGVKMHLVCEARLQGLLRDWLEVEIEGRYTALIERLGPFQADATASPEALAAHEALGKPPPVDPHKVERVMHDIEESERAEDQRRKQARSGRIDLLQATEACQQASHRDEIIDITLRFARQFMPFVGLFVTSNEFIVGWDAVGSKDARERIKKIRLPTGIATVLSMVTQTNAYYLGPIPETVGNTEMLRDLGRKKPRNVLVIPIMLHKRLIGLLYGDAGIRAIRGGSIGDLLVFASRLSGAFEQLILRNKKAAGQRIQPRKQAAVPAEPAVSVFDTQLPPVVASRPEEEPASTPEVIEPAPPPAPEPAPPPAPEPAPPVDNDEPVVVDDSFLNAGLEASSLHDVAMPPAIDAAALGIPTDLQPGDDALHPDEERVKFEHIDEEDESVAIISYDDGQVVVVDTSSEFAPEVETPTRPAPIPLGGSRTTPLSDLQPDKEEPAPPATTPPATTPPVTPPATTPPVTPPATTPPVTPPAPEAPAAEPPPEATVSIQPALPAEPAELELEDAFPVPPPDTHSPEEQRIDRVERYVRDLVCGERETMARACELLAAMHPPPVEPVMAHFPGQLAFDIRGAYDSVPPLAEHSELLRCLLEMGADACPYVVERIEDPDTRVRFYAVKFFGETYCPRSVPRLAKRLYDRDALIRLTTIDVLQTYRRTPAFETMLKGLRERLRSSEVNQQAISAALLGNFKDRDALPLLAELVKSSQKMVSRAAIESLSFITKQDFGTSERKWIKWWKTHKGQSRVEWLIAGLRSKNRDIRFSSAQELNQLTQEYFGYYFDSTKDDREKAVRRWETWWQEKGRSLYVDL